MNNLILTEDNLHNLELFQELLDKDKNTLINEALEEYFLNSQKRLLEKKFEDEKKQTNLSFDEFWDDVDV